MLPGHGLAGQYVRACRACVRECVRVCMYVKTVCARRLSCTPSSRNPRLGDTEGLF